MRYKNEHITLKQTSQLLEFQFVCCSFFKPYDLRVWFSVRNKCLIQIRILNLILSGVWILLGLAAVRLRLSEADKLPSFPLQIQLMVQTLELLSPDQKHGSLSQRTLKNCNLASSVAGGIMSSSCLSGLSAQTSIGLNGSIPVGCLFHWFYSH